MLLHLKRLEESTYQAEPSHNAGVVTTLPSYQDPDFYGSCNFGLYLYPKDWQGFDSLTFYLNMSIESLSSVTASVGDLFIYPEVSYFNSSDVESFSTVTVTIDLTGIDRSQGSLSLFITGLYHSSNSESYFGRIVHCYGFVTNTTDNVVVTWFRKIYSVITNGFSNLLSKLDDVFGVNDTSVDAAVQTQEEINVSVNNQLVGAVEDWNTNIEVVQTGYDSAVTKAAPALGWLASLADRIFTNMGWFGNIYFLVGLISVIMLVLSKSGLARSVSRFRRNE